MGSYLGKNKHSQTVPLFYNFFSKWIEVLRQFKSYYHGLYNKEKEKLRK